MSVKLFGHGISQPTRFVSWVCALGNQKYTFIQTDPTKEQTKTLDFIAMNPSQTIPVYQETDTNGEINVTKNIFRPILRGTIAGKPTDGFFEKGFETLKPTFEIIEQWLTKNEYLISNSVTLADLSCFCELAQLEETYIYDYKDFPKIQDWIKKIKQVPHYETYSQSLKKLNALIQKKKERDGKL